MLFDRLQLPHGKKTQKGYSTSAEVLENLRDIAPEIIDPLLRYRQLTKLNGTYIEGLLRLMGPEGRIHSTFDQVATATGRISSSEPNLQNIPVRTAQGREIRRAFVPRKGWVLLDADYSQIELRLMAHFSGDKALVEAFRTGQDVHARTASEIFDVPLSEVTPTLRSRAKAVNFGLIYGISGFGPGAKHRRHPEGGQGVHCPVLRQVSRREALHGRSGTVGPGAGLRGNPAGAAALPARAQFLPQRHPEFWPPGGHEHPRPGHRRGHHQAGHGARGRGPCAGRTCRPR